jgi:hypothetical protein
MDKEARRNQRAHSCKIYLRTLRKLDFTAFCPLYSLRWTWNKQTAEWYYLTWYFCSIVCCFVSVLKSAIRMLKPTRRYDISSINEVCKSLDFLRNYVYVKVYWMVLVIPFFFCSIFVLILKLATRLQCLHTSISAVNAVCASVDILNELHYNSIDTNWHWSFRFFLFICNSYQICNWLKGCWVYMYVYLI